MITRSEVIICVASAMLGVAATLSVTGYQRAGEYVALALVGFVWATRRFVRKR